MLRPATLLLPLLCAALHLAAQQTPSPIERLDPALDALIPANAQLETVASGFTWTEGPVWVHAVGSSAGALYFAEITSNSIRRLNADGSVTIFMQPSGYAGAAPYGGREPGSNGMTLDAAGRLTVAGHAGRDVWRLESLDPHATRTILADAYQGKRLNSPNDLVYRADGSLYFTDPPYGLRQQNDSDPEKQLAFSGVYRIPAAAAHQPGAPPDNAHLQLLIRDLPRPNGIAFSPDQRFLYVDNTEPKKQWLRYPVHADGSLGAGEVFVDATADKRPGAPDGMKLDRDGNIYSAGPGGIWVISPAGKHLGTILLPHPAGNLAWGDADAKTLYITDSGALLRLRVNVPGIRP